MIGLKRWIDERLNVDNVEPWDSDHSISSLGYELMPLPRGKQELGCSTESEVTAGGDKE